MGMARAAQVAGVLLAILTSGCGALASSDPVPAQRTLVLGDLPATRLPVEAGADQVVRVAVASPAGTGPDGADAVASVAIGAAATADVGAIRVPGPAPHDLTMAFTGDTLMHSPLVEQAARAAGGHGYDFAPMLARIAPLISAADLAVCHLETPIAPPGEALSTFPLYGVPAEVVTGLASTGYDRCSTASNHTMDRGVAGIDATIAALGLAGLGQSGMASEPAGIEPQLFTVDGVVLSHLSHTYGFNGIPLPRDQPWRSAQIDPARIVADATRAREIGAQLVIVSLHWGTEGQSAVTPEQRAVADAITAGGQIDLVVGHHAHVLQTIEQVHGVWVVYGLSNLVSNLGEIAGWPAGAADGAVAEVRFVQQDDGRYIAEPPVVHPTWVDAAAGWTVRPVLADLADPAVPEGVKARLQASLERTASVLGAFLPAA
jgi:poly-gamma-glutamate capsule biosynthesis protein CapA/YwtB (metallophosphatase superfamily)